jgi:serine/threonine-protein kinase
MKICPKCNGSFEEGLAYCPNDGGRLTTVSKMQLAGQAVPQEAVAAQAQLLADEGIEDLTGRVIAGRYNITRRIGEGGMGVVYAAVDTRLEKPVAIKVLKEDFAHRQDVVARFTQEAKSAARIKHENVLDVTDYGQTEDGSFYIAMELLVGTDLADVLQKNGSLPTDRAVNIMVQVTRALGAAHAKGIVHRDLKPENIFLVTADDGREVVKIVDFGIAQMKDISDAGGGGKKLTRTGMIFGTPEYMSPEQAAGKPIDQRVDIYAVGVILYEVFAGRVPFVGDTFMGILTQHMFEMPPPIRSLRPDADLPADLEAIIAKALAKDPAHRYQSMQELTDDLVRLRDGLRPSAVGAVIPGPAMRPNMTGGYAPVAPHGTAMTVPGISSAQGNTVTPVSNTIETESSHSRKALIAVALVGALAVGGAGVALIRSGNGQAGTVTTSQANTTGTQGGRTVAQQGSTTPPQPANPIADAGAALPAQVHVRIASTPGSARVEVEGQAGLSCPQTPCELTLPRGREVRLLASAPRKRGELVFTPERDGQAVSVALTTLSGGTPSHMGGGSTGGNANARSNPRCRPGQLQWFDRREMIYRPCVN